MIKLYNILLEGGSEGKRKAEEAKNKLKDGLKQVLQYLK